MTTLSDVKEELARKIRYRLKELGMKRKDFAQRMGVQPSVVTRWLSGKCNFEIMTIFRIEAVLEINLIIVV